MTEPKKAPSKPPAVESGQPAHPYDPETGQFLDGPHPDEEPAEPSEAETSEAPETENQPE